MRTKVCDDHTASALAVFLHHDRSQWVNGGAAGQARGTRGASAGRGWRRRFWSCRCSQTSGRRIAIPIQSPICAIGRFSWHFAVGLGGRRSGIAIKADSRRRCGSYRHVGGIEELVSGQFRQPGGIGQEEGPEGQQGRRRNRKNLQAVRHRRPGQGPDAGTERRTAANAWRIRCSRKRRRDNHETTRIGSRSLSYRRPSAARRITSRSFTAQELTNGTRTASRLISSITPTNRYSVSGVRPMEFSACVSLI